MPLLVRHHLLSVYDFTLFTINHQYACHPPACNLKTRRLGYNAALLCLAIPWFLALFCCFQLISSNARIEESY